MNVPLGHRPLIFLARQYWTVTFPLPSGPVHHRLMNAHAARRRSQHVTRRQGSTFGGSNSYSEMQAFWLFWFCFDQKNLSIFDSSECLENECRAGQQ